MLVYIVDDDASVRQGLSRLMRSAGIDSRSYAGAEAFLAEVSNDERACIVLDITMPHMDGLQLGRRLRQAGIALPVIAVSARDDDATRQLAMKLQVRMFLRKPVDDQALIDAISWVVQERRAAAPARLG
jgi:FixJ family two-component response regulator